MKVRFSKYSGLGNDFIFIDDREKLLELTPQQIQELCHRTRGIGADGLVLLQSSASCDFKMRIFNADGHEAEMCGNALRCFYFFIQQVQPSFQTKFLIETFDRRLHIEGMGQNVRCEMGQVKDVLLDVSLDTSYGFIQGHFANTGVPHFIVFREDIQSIPVEKLGEELSHHPFFQPARTNVNFVQKNLPQRLSVRTFERGVERETEACGTGAAAAAVLSALLFDTMSPIEVRVKNGAVLEFEFEKCQNQILNLTMSGEARHIFDGEVTLQELALNK